MREYLGPAKSGGAGREQSAGIVLCVGKGFGLGESGAAGGGWLCLEEREASAGCGLGEGLGNVEEPGGRRGCWVRVGLLGRGGFAEG